MKSYFGAACVWLRLLLATGILLCAGSVFAQGVKRDFDHVQTGFPLTGLHTNARCESCHVNAIFKGTPKDCASCHVSGSRVARNSVVKPVQHVPTQEACNTCHTTHGFGGVKFNHDGVKAGTCATCHNGNLAPGKSPAHIPVTASVACDSCHRSFGAWAPTAWNHSQTVVAGQCSTCHSGAFPPADGRHTTHIPYQSLSGVAIANCDSCHRAGFATWAPAKFHTSVSVSNQCASCHNGSYAPAVGKPNTPIHTGVTACESCHSTSGWAGARVNHSSFTAATHCASCHNGSTATGKPAAHIPVGTTNCISCHSVSAWRPTRFNHTQVIATNQCATCHSGASPPADGRPTNHIPYQTLTGVAITNCDTCHRSGFTAWAPARFHANVSVSTQCARCHTGNHPPAVGKPNTPVHLGVTVCETCHRSASSWGAVLFAHSAAQAVGSGTCDTCHNGSTARGKPATHIPVLTGPTKCDACHRSQVSFGTAVTMNHSMVAATSCKTCHNGSFVTQGTTGALAKPANHIPETQLLNGAAMDCVACHTSTSNWGSQRMNHNGSLGGGSGWCKACHASGTSFLGNMEKKALTHRTKTPPAIDCSESGCHRPLGTRGGTNYSNWD